MNRWTTKCTIGIYPAEAEVAEETFDEHLTAFFGRADVKCHVRDESELKAIASDLASDQVPMTLEDGRTASIKICWYKVCHLAPTEPDGEPVNQLTCWFVALSQPIDQMELFSNPGRFIERILPSLN